MRRRLGMGTERDLFLPRAGEFIGYRRLRDWLRLLSFEVESGRFGCYIPPVTSAKWLARFGWMERAGDRWWPSFGALYYIVAVKRVRGMRLVGLVRDEVAAEGGRPPRRRWQRTGAATPNSKPMATRAERMTARHDVDGLHRRRLRPEQSRDPPAGVRC